MSKIIGISQVHFSGKTGEIVEGATIFYTDPIDPKRGQGESAERIFLSAAKLADLGFTPALGQEITPLFNRYGKVATIKLDDDIGID